MQPPEVIRLFYAIESPLPPVLVPNSSTGFKRKPPILRCGYPLILDDYVDLLKRANSPYATDVPDTETLDHLFAMHHIVAYFSELIGWPLKLKIVLGSPDYWLIELRDNFMIGGRRDPPLEVDKKFKEAMKAEEDPKWYLDIYKCQWDWSK